MESDSDITNEEAGPSGIGGGNEMETVEEMVMDEDGTYQEEEPQTTDDGPRDEYEGTSARCRDCKEILRSYNEITQHLRQVRFNARHQRTFGDTSSSSELTEKSTIHPYPTSIDCLNCGRTFPSFGSFYRHVREYHNILKRKHNPLDGDEEEEKFGKCGVCMEVFSTYDEMVLHERIIKMNVITTHDPYRTTYNCMKCRKKFPDPHRLKLHVRAHNTEYYRRKRKECSICKKKFFNIDNLKAHSRTVHTVIKPHKCKYCNVGFQFSSRLTVHTRIHTGEKPFKCELCGREFRLKQNAKKHMDNERRKPIEKRCDYKPHE